MKVGTDSVILGSWAQTCGLNNGLDIGTGTGLLALMLAQKGVKKITAIELDEAACLQANENINSSRFKNQITLVHSSFQNYFMVSPERFDLIIANPPYFNSSLKSKDEKKTIARHDETLIKSELLHGVKTLLTDYGKFFCIIPYTDNHIFLSLARDKGLFASRTLLVFSKKEQSIPKRIAFQLEKVERKNIAEQLYIENNFRHDFTASYKELTGEFYINF